MAVVRGKSDVRDQLNAYCGSKDLPNGDDATRGACESQMHRQPTRNNVGKKQVRCQQRHIDYLVPARHRADLWAGHPDQLDCDANPLFRGCFLLATGQEFG